MKWPTIKLGDLYVPQKHAVDPAEFPKEVFELYSVPAYDAKVPEKLAGNEIGSAKQSVAPGDVLLCRIVPHIRRAWVVGCKNGSRMIGSSEWIILRNKQVYPDFLKHFLLSNSFHSQFMLTVAGVGGSLLRARPAAAAEIDVPLPPLEEQRRIAAILDKTDALRQKRRLAIQKLDSLTQSIFLEMFGDSATNPKRLPLEPLNEFLIFVTSGARGWAEFYAANGTRFIRSLDVQMNHISDSEPAYVMPPDNAEARRTRVKAGDVLLTITGSRIGRVSPVSPKFEGSFISQHVAILRLDSAKLSPEFLSYFLSLDGGGQRQIASAQYGQTKPGLNFEQIRRFKIPVPPLNDQHEFVDCIRCAKKIVKLSEQSAVSPEHLFASLQQRAFRGEL